MKTRVTELLGIEKPIIQGGMAWAAESHLAAAVSNGGGFGLHRSSQCTGRCGQKLHPRGKRTDGQAFWCKYHADESVCRRYRTACDRGEGRSGYDRSRKPGEIYGAVESRRYQGDPGNCICSSRKNGWSVWAQTQLLQRELNPVDTSVRATTMTLVPAGG